MEEDFDEEGFIKGTTIEDMRINALIDLRESLIDPIKQQSDNSAILLETVDLALDKLINQTIIKTQ